MEQLAVRTCSDFVDGLDQSVLFLKSRFPATYRWVQVDKDGAGDVFAAARLGEEGLERASLRDLLRIRVGAAIRLEAVLEQVPGSCGSIRVRGIRVDSGTYSSHALLPSCVPAWPM